MGTLACKAGYVYQDFENQIVRPTVLDDAPMHVLTMLWRITENGDLRL